MIKKNIATNESGFIFNPSTGESFSSNPVAIEIVELLKKNTSTSEIKNILYSKYEMDKMTIEKDVDDFIMLLKDYSLLNH